MVRQKKSKGGALSASELQEFVTNSYSRNRDKATNIGGYQLDKDLSSRRAAVYHDPVTGKTIVANRGTIGTLSDWSNNALSMLGLYDKTKRFKQAQETQDATIAKYGKVDTNVGHSQGAILARKLNGQGKTGEVITVNGATMPWDKQAKNETRVRSGLDLVSGLDVLAPSRTRNVTIDAASYNPLTEHSGDVLRRLDPVTVIGKGFIKTYYY